jgi:aminoglycoside phosphotransferase (APT) family kinase protein
VRSNRNEIEFDDHVVRRWPRTDLDRADLPNIALRHQAAYDFGLPVPRVLQLCSDHLVLERAPGTPLVQTHLTPDGQRRLGADIADFLRRLRAIATWALPVVSWPDLWKDLHAVANVAETAFAAEVAASAATSLTHGDLSWGNLMVSPAGELLSVIDWDGAAIADPAQDYCAVRANVDPLVADTIRAQTPSAAQLQARADAYLATWPVQNRLWLDGRHPWAGR